MQATFLTLAVVSLLGTARIAAGQDSTARYGDSTTFDPDGYYVPAADLRVHDAVIRHFEVRTLQYYYGDALHYSRPRLLTPRAYVVVVQGAQSARYDCTLVLANTDSLRLACANTPVGDLTLETAYLDKRGRYWNIIDYEQGPRVVARGRVLFHRAGSPTESRPLDLLYTAGD
jgi:hypothetical protein